MCLNKTKEEIAALFNQKIRKIEDKYFLSFHCGAAESLLIEQVLNATNRFEYLFKDKMVVIHVEPFIPQKV